MSNVEPLCELIREGGIAAVDRRLKSIMARVIEARYGEPIQPQREPLRDYPGLGEPPCDE